MSNTAPTKTKQKKSKITLDRLLSIKKTVLDSLSLLSKHDKPSPQVERNNTVPSGEGKFIYRKISNDDRHRSDGFNMTQIAAGATVQHSNKKINEACYPAELPQTTILQNSLQRIRTWPHDDYSVHILQDEYPARIPNNIQAETLQSHCLDKRTGWHQNAIQMQKNSSSQTNSIIRSVKNQAIQTDEDEVFDVNADIIRYLSQFNDKVTLSMYTPNLARKSSVVCHCYYEHDYYLYNDPRNYEGCLSTRPAPRTPEEFISLSKRHQHSHEFNYRPQYDYSPLAYLMPQKHHEVPISNEPQRQQKYDTTELRSGTSDTFDMTFTNGSNFLALPRFDTRVPSEDSASILSSETDSDFIFYPCSTLAQTTQYMTLIDSRNTSFLSQPPDLPENINTNFSWRSDFYGSSLDEVTLQFFLDDDALSDDVFIDDYDLTYSMNATQESDRYVQHEPIMEPTSGCNKMFVMSHQGELECISHQEDETIFRESYSDNCYAYRYADIDEVLNSLHKQEQSWNQTSGYTLSPLEAAGEAISSSSDPDVQCSSDDTHLELGHEFSNVFDSLRRNSTQAKARKMWRQRRAKCKKNSAGVSDSDVNKEQLNTSLCQPTIFTFDDNNIHNHSQPLPLPKPLRGILKNKECKSPDDWKYEVWPNQARDFDKFAGIKMEIPRNVMMDIHFPFSPCAYASVQNRESPSVTISNSDGVMKGCIEHPVHELSQNTSPISEIVKDESSVDNTVTTLPQLSDVGPEKHENLPSSHGSTLSSQQPTQETSPSNMKPNDQFHFILSSDTEGARKIIAVRKSSLEAYEWTRSLQRRHRRLVRKENSFGSCPKSNM